MRERILGMKRDPMDEKKKRYNNAIREKKIRPRIFWQQCECCGKEYRKTPMFRIEKGYLALEMQHSYYGCTDCFDDMNAFRTWLEKTGRLLSEDDFEFLREFKRDDHTPSIEDLERYVKLLWL